jgi:BlaI family penicillinase repressor
VSLTHSRSIKLTCSAKSALYGSTRVEYKRVASNITPLPVQSMTKKRSETSATPTAPTTGIPALTEGEWDVMQIVWGQAPCAAGTVQEALQDSHGWAYSTVKTMMDRMCAKGILAMHSIRNLQLFTPAINREQARSSEFHKFLKRAFNGAVAPMIQFLVESEELSDAELDLLRKQIHESGDRKQSKNR